MGENGVQSGFRNSVSQQDDIPMAECTAYLHLSPLMTLTAVGKVNVGIVNTGQLSA